MFNLVCYYTAGTRLADPIINDYKVNVDLLARINGGGRRGGGRKEGRIYHSHSCLSLSGESLSLLRLNCA